MTYTNIFKKLYVKKMLKIKTIVDLKIKNENKKIRNNYLSIMPTQYQCDKNVTG